MKQATNNSKDTMNKKASQKQIMKNKKAEANARRKLNKSWEKMEHTPRYRSASAKEVCDTITKKIEIEVLDGILLNLSIKSQAKSASVQNRILRRIVEKRQAQANHKKFGRTEDLTSIHISITGTSRCIEAIRKKRFAA
ncbi:hypothetical protein [uncultured Prevotella sp.]|uniref:hypothetical protein n=1 Tax=uncultured Prevotella sp. TaxID=159272 RepID=UPI0026727495|nr:hypothetical protein [uncultured Prevotella sp.]